jgi:hypothetical protein
VARYEVSAPKPDRQRRACVLHDGARCQPVIPLAFPAAENMRSVSEPVRFAGVAAPPADETVAPADGPQIRSAGRLVGKEALELGE